MPGGLPRPKVARPQAQAPLDFEALVRDAAAAYGIPEALLAAVIRVESGNRQGAVSPKGAIGYGQLMPRTAEALGADPTDPIDNVATTALHLSSLISRYKGNVELALAAYNAGEPAVNKAGGIPDIPETKAYVKKVQQALVEGVTPKVPRSMIGSAAASQTAPPVANPSAAVAWGLPKAFPVPGSAVMPTPGGPYGGGAGIGGDISNKQMEKALADIAAERAGALGDLDMSRQYEERSPYAYGGLDSGGGGIGGAYGTSIPDYSLGSAAATPSIASLYSGGTMGGGGGGNWFTRLFGRVGGGGGPRFTDRDEFPSER